MASAACNDVIVWEFESDRSSLFLPYDHDVSNSLEKNYVKNKTCKRCTLNSQTMRDYTVDFSRMKQVSTYGSLRSIRRQQYDGKYHISKGILWMWLTDSGWLPYDVLSTQVIEDAYAQGATHADLEYTSWCIPYKIHIAEGYQRNKHSGFIRPIKRVNVAYTVVSGNACRCFVSVKPGSSQTASTSTSQMSNDADDETDDFYKKYSSFCKPAPKKQQSNADNEDPCPICLCELDGSSDIALLTKCGHELHLACLKEYVKHQSKGNVLHSLQCPKCKVTNGVKRGNQPPGTMDVQVIRSRSVAGYPGCGMIQITYNFLPGIQTADHPNPGRRYHTHTFPRVAYLPNNEDGGKVLKLLKVAFERKLTFTVGQSVTTGQQDCVVWNEIHHKTSAHDNYSGHGYPDPNYIANVTEELKQHGVTEADIT